MATVIFIDKEGNSVLKTMEIVPRVGDMVPLFNKLENKAEAVVWFPELVVPELVLGKSVDVVITTG